MHENLLHRYHMYKTFSYVLAKQRQEKNAVTGANM